MTTLRRTNPIPLIKEARRLERTSKAPSTLSDVAEFRKEAAILIRERGLAAEGRGSTHAAESLGRMASRLNRSALGSRGAANHKDRELNEILGSSQGRPLLTAMGSLFMAKDLEVRAMNTDGGVQDHIKVYEDTAFAAKRAVSELAKLRENATPEVKGMLERSFYDAVNIALSSFVTAAELSVITDIEKSKRYTKEAQEIHEEHGFNYRYPFNPGVLPRLDHLPHIIAGDTIGAIVHVRSLQRLLDLEVRS